MEVTRVSIVNLYSSSLYYYSIPFLVIIGSLHVRRGTRKSACGNEKHACDSQSQPRGGEEDEKRRQRKKYLETRERERERESLRKNLIANIRTVHHPLELETLPHYREEKSPEGVSDLGRARRGNGALWKLASRSTDRREVSKLDSCYFEHPNIIHGVSSTDVTCCRQQRRLYSGRLTFRTSRWTDLRSRERMGCNFNLRIIGGSRISRVDGSIRLDPFKKKTISLNIEILLLRYLT